MQKIKKPEQKIVTFSDSEEDFDKVQFEIDQGWNIVGMYFNGKNFVGILEKSDYANQNFESEDFKLFIPPRKKLRFS